MNRLVIIGNGFDLAHGLPTSYGHFIDDYWQKISKNFYRHLSKHQYVDELIEVFYEFNTNYHDVFYNISLEINEVKNYEDFNDFIQKYSKSSNPIVYEDMNGCKFHFKNDLFLKINADNIENWVDIENLYYSELKKIVKSKCLDVSKSEEYWKKEQSKQVKKLNEEFEDIKKLLEKYLYDKVENGYHFMVSSKEQTNKLKIIYQSLKPISLFNNASTILEEFTNKDDVDEIKYFFSREENDEHLNSELYFLNFNYTSTIDIIYKELLQDEKTNVFMNFIHGKIGNNKENKINFGFGDEMDDDYKSIENINDNEYLKYFKSFQYLQNSNYSNLLNYIDSNKFQVLIMGHSCGLSDRTLLNTIFEHTNCRSIKVFYHKKENGKDNYTEIIQNISRHFNKKKLMREKIVNKTLCKPLPQLQLPKIE